MKLLMVILVSLIIVSCDSTTESDPETLTGFWQAKEIAQHFWLDHIKADSVSGFGQVGISNDVGLVEWLPITVEGKITGSDISLQITVSDSTNAFNGEIITVRNFLGLWEIANDTISVTYNKRVTNN
jgi:hypothetical protein